MTLEQKRTPEFHAVEYDGIDLPEHIRQIANVPKYRCDRVRTAITNSGEIIGDGKNAGCGNTFGEIYVDMIRCPNPDKCPFRKLRPSKGWHDGNLLDMDYMTFTWTEMLLHLQTFHDEVRNCHHENAESKTRVSNGTWFSQWVECPDCEMILHSHESRSEDTWA